MSESDPKLLALENLQADILACRVCESFAPNFAKPPAMDRGTSDRIMIVGQGPGQSEVREQRAFSGPSGKRLDEWLKGCGCPADSPRRNIYVTSVTKCYTSDGSKAGRMANLCAKFLQRQLELIRPRLVITLGASAYEQLAVDGTPVQEAWCRMFDSRMRYPLLPAEDQFEILVWPHPSPLNRWLNTAENRQRLESTFPYVRQFVEGQE